MLPKELRPGDADFLSAPRPACCCWTGTAGIGLRSGGQKRKRACKKTCKPFRIWRSGRDSLNRCKSLILLEVLAKNDEKPRTFILPPGQQTTTKQGMSMDGLTRILYREMQVSGLNVTIWECGEVPPMEYGDSPMDTMSRPMKNVFYEASTGNGKTFYKSRNPPDIEELRFALEKPSDTEKFMKIVMYVGGGLAFLWALSFLGR